MALVGMFDRDQLEVLEVIIDDMNRVLWSIGSSGAEEVK